MFQEEVIKVDAFFRHYIKNMKDHCDAGMGVPKDISLEAFLDRKKRLLATVNELQGPKEFESQKRKFACHVVEFEQFCKEKTCSPPNC